MRKRLFALLIAPLVVLFALVALAQPHKAHGKKDKGKSADKTPAAATSAQAGDAGAQGAAAQVSVSGNENIGGPPPKTARGDGGPKPSPLNPAANEFPEGGAPAPPPDYNKLLGDIAALRSRVAAMTTTMFASKLQVIVETDDSSDARITSFNVTLDDGVIYSAPKNFSAEDERTVYEHAVAPGHHVIGVDVERYDVRGKEYQTWQSSKFSVVVPEGKRLSAHLQLEDDSGMAADFPDDQDGEYDLRVRLRALVVD